MKKVVVFMGSGSQLCTSIVRIKYYFDHHVLFTRTIIDYLLRDIKISFGARKL